MLKEFILALLITKFSGVRNDGLAQLAGTLALQADKEDEATALVEKFTPEKVTNFVKDWRAGVDKEVSTSTKTFEETLKGKFDLVEKKAPTPTDPPTPTPSNPNDIGAIIAAEVAKALAPMAQQLAGFQGQEVNKTRLQQLEGHLKDVPETFKEQKLKDFGRMNFENDEAFNEYLTETETNVSAFNQELTDKGLSSHAKPMFGNAGNDGVSSAVSTFITSKTDDTKALGGKEL